MRLDLIKSEDPRGMTTYLVMIDGWAAATADDENTATKKYNHIKEIGKTAYLQEILIKKTTLLSEEVE